MGSMDACNNSLSRASYESQDQSATNCGPLIWRRMSVGVRIQDAMPENFDDVVDLILNFYVPHNPLYKSSKILEDAESLATFKEMLYSYLKQGHSLVAVDECTDRIVGALVLSLVKKSTFGLEFDRLEIGRGKALRTITSFVNDASRMVDIFERFQCDVYMRYMFTCVHGDYRTNGIGQNMLSASIDVAHYLDVPVIMGIADQPLLQKVYLDLGMTIQYSSKVIELENDVDDLGSRENYYQCLVMGCLVLPPSNPEPKSNSADLNPAGKNKSKISRIKSKSKKDL
ncbi:unnamed protein product [Phyllotreta striolata]|uniref:N-acetyltransferase domain-containing protein n=1 Tax=Phyllotreta striolata TaxID=444603 RepID=A0A9N9XMD3_PHYSR|nr:unnamed protein product [Phyllotreta striolata]